MSAESLPLPLDTGVLITLAAATGSWSVLDSIRRPITITPTVLEEVRSGPSGSLAVTLHLPPVCRYGVENLKYPLIYWVVWIEGRRL